MLINDLYNNNNKTAVAESVEDQLPLDTLNLIDEYIAKVEPGADRNQMIQHVVDGSIHTSELEYALQDDEPGVTEGAEGKVVFSGTGANGSTYEIVQSSPTDFMIHVNGKHIDTYGSLQRAMSVLKNEVPGLQQGVAEGGAKDRQWSNKDMERLRVATRDFDDIMASDGPEATKQNLIKKRIQTKPMAGPKGVLPEQGVAEAAGSREKFTDLKSWAAAAKQQGLRVGPANGDSDYDYSYWAVGKGGEVFGKFVTTRVPQNNHGYIKKQGVAEGTLDEAVGMMIKGAAISGANDQDIADRIAAKTGGRVDSGSYGHHVLITYPTTQDRARAAVKIRKMFPGIELYKSGGNRNAIDEQGMAEGSGPVTHRIGLTVTDPNHPMVSKRKEPYQKSVRVTQDVPDREAAINQAIAHHRRKGYKVHDHHYIGTVDDEPIAEVSLGDYRKKATVNKAVAQTDRFFGRDDAAKVAAADQTIAKREKGLARADARVKPYTPPAFDAEKQQRDLTAKYPNIDQLVADAERNRDPYYDRAEGNAYYAGREAEQNYQKLKQIQRVIQGLNESRKKLDEFNPFSKKKVDTTSPTTEPQAAGGMKFDLMGRPYKPAPVTPNYDKSVADYSDTTMNAPAASVPNIKSMMPTNMMPSTAPVAKSVDTATPMNPYQVTTARTTTTPATVPNTAMTTTAPELQTIDAPAQLTGPAQAKQLGMANPDITDVVAKAPTAKRVSAPNLAALPAPAAPIAPNYSSGVTNATINAPTASVPTTKSMMPANMMPRTATAPPNPAVSTTAAKNDIVQALKKLGYKSKEAEAAIRGLPPNISTSDAIRQILRGKPTTTESLTWSKNFDPGRSLYKKLKQDR